MRITANDINGVVAIIPTPSTPDAADWRAANTVDLEQTRRLVDAVVGAGVNVLMTTGTFGEGATLTWGGLQDFARCVVETTRGRCPVFVGVTTLNTRETIQRARGLVELGADGLFLGRPMWLPLDNGAIVRYYRSIAEALPGVPQVVYDNPHAFKGKISADAYGQLAKIPEVVAAKHLGGAALEVDLKAAGRSLRLLPTDGNWCELAQKYPDDVTACWSGNVACGPAVIVALARAIARRDWRAAREIEAEITWAAQAQVPGGVLNTFLDNSIPIGNARFRGAGLFQPGPTRPPYTEAPAEYIAGGEETGRRFAKLQKKYAAAERLIGSEVSA